MASTLSIVITYNGLTNNWIQKCLKSLIESSLPTDIIVIDNASTDNTTRYIETHFPFVELIKSGKNIGFGQANNIGLKKCLDRNYDFAFLLNQDAWIEKNTIERLVSMSLVNPVYGVVSPIHLNGGGNSLDYNFSIHINAADCPKLISDIYLNNITQASIYPINFTNAAAWLISRTCLEKVGGFNPSFFHYGEDDNYIHRLYFHGFKLGVIPFARIYHDRENRPSSNYFNEINNYKRSILIQLSNPLIHFSLKKEKLQIVYLYIKVCLFAKIADKKILKEKLSFVFGLKEKIILRYKYKSMKEKAFL